MEILGFDSRQWPVFWVQCQRNSQKVLQCGKLDYCVDGRSNVMVMLGLLESHCVSVLAYAVEVVHIADPRDKLKLRIAYNSIFRKLFNYSWRESVTELQKALGRPTWEDLIANRKSNFLARFNSLPVNSLVRHLPH